jgi:HEAT repeat protein
MVVAVQVEFDRLIEDLGIEHRAKDAMRSLMAAGMSATPAVRRGLMHHNPRVRARCCGVLDHFLDADAIPELMDNLRHDDPEVRLMAMHALGCDRCKEGSCRPAKDFVVAAAMRLLADDPDRHVRTVAANALGPAVHRHHEALEAVIAAHDADADPLVRKVAGWYWPGGPIYERLRPRAERQRPRAAAGLS